MPKPLFVLFDLGVYMLATGCLYHAWHQDRTRLFGLVAGMSYGVLLEYATIRSYQSYAYGHFLIMLFESVPLCIGLSWGMIIYTAMETSDRFGLPWYLRPVLDALLALTIDLSMDAIAIRLGFWTWTQPGAWFGVPLANFYAWFIVVCGFSLLLRLGRLWSLGGRLMLLIDLALAILAITLSIVGLMALLPPVIALVSLHAAAARVVEGQQVDVPRVRHTDPERKHAGTVHEEQRGSDELRSAELDAGSRHRAHVARRRKRADPVARGRFLSRGDASERQRRRQAGAAQ